MFCDAYSRILPCVSKMNTPAEWSTVYDVGDFPGFFKKSTRNSFATFSVAAASPRRPTKLGWKAGTYSDITSPVSRSGSTVMNTTCSLSPSAPSFSRTSRSVDSVVGQTSGHWT